MNPREAKKVIAAKLQELGLPSYKLTAKTVGFQDLGRVSRVFVKIHGWQPDRDWDELKKTASENGFFVQTDGPFG